MKTVSKLVVVTLSLFTINQASANLVVNGGFETGSFAPWGNLPIAAVATGNAHSGTFAADLGPLTGTAYQSLPFVAGVPYQLDFWVKDSGDGLAVFTVNLVEDPLDLPLYLQNIATFNPTTTYTQKSYTFTPLQSGDLFLAFTWGDGFKHAYLDDVSLAAVPEPTTMIAGALLLLPFGLSAVRRFRK